MYSHGFLKVAASSPKCRLGDAMYNVKEMLSVLKTAERKTPSIICFPELCICGYSIGDLVFQKYMYDENLNAIKYFLENNTYKGVVIFGSFITINDTLFNCVFISQGKKIIGIVPKSFLPHTNEFYESRWFISGTKISEQIHSVNLFGYEIPFGKIIFESLNKEVSFGAEVCVDMWTPFSPNEKLFANGALIVFNASASPESIGKAKKREILTMSTSLKLVGAYVYVSNNASESTSEVVFSGHKLISENGKILAQDKRINLDSSIIYGDIDIFKIHFLRKNGVYFKSIQEFARDNNILRVNFDLIETADFTFENEFDKLPFVPKLQEELNEIIEMQAVSVVKRLEYIGIEKVVLGISGGLDSTLALLSLCYAFDKYGIDRKNIIGIRLPSLENSQGTHENSVQLMEKLNITSREIPIQDEVKRQLKAIGHNGVDRDITYENVQARFRTYTLMNTANLEKAIVIGTSDMSEVALGWSTFNGDQMAMYGINSGITKTVIRELVKYYIKIYPNISEVLQSILMTPISPELSSSTQKTEDIIGKYEINDFILYRFLVNGDDSNRIIYLLQKVFAISKAEAEKYLKNFNNRFYTQQYKRLTMPEGVKILELSLSPRAEFRLNGDMYPRK